MQVTLFQVAFRSLTRLSVTRPWLSQLPWLLARGIVSRVVCVAERLLSVGRLLAERAPVTDRWLDVVGVVGHRGGVLVLRRAYVQNR